MKAQDGFHHVMDEVKEFARSLSDKEGKVLLVVTVNYFQAHGTAYNYFSPGSKGKEPVSEESAEGSVNTHESDVSNPG